MKCYEKSNKCLACNGYGFILDNSRRFPLPGRHIQCSTCGGSGINDNTKRTLDVNSNNTIVDSIELLNSEINNIKELVNIINLRTCTHESETLRIGMPADEIHIKNFYARVKCNVCGKITKTYNTERDYLLSIQKRETESLQKLKKRIRELEE